jgi:hypothetical protein
MSMTTVDRTPVRRATGFPGAVVDGTQLRCTGLHGFQAAAIFYPDFYPKRQCSRVEMLYLLVTVANWSSRTKCCTSFPSWSCGFDSPRPLRLIQLTNRMRAVRAIERLYGSAEFDAYRELGSALVGLTIKDGELKEFLT